MGLDINSPFAQALIQEGQSRGYTPYDIAAAIGNANAENGLQTSGIPGDGGLAFGGMQWRGDRFDALKATAGKMNLPWTDPRAQAAHWYNEQDAAGKDGAKGATSLADANDNVIGSLRPAGYSPDTPDNTAVSAYAKRLAGSQQALAGIDPDLPSGGATEVSGALAPGTLPGGGVDPGATPPVAGGVLSQSQQPEYQPTMSDRLDKLSAALLRRDSPGAAASIDNNLQQRIAQQQAFLKAQQASDTWSAGKTIKNADGQYVTLRTNDKTGQTASSPTPKDQIPAEDAEDTTPTRQEVQATSAQNTAIQNLGQLTPVREAVNTLRDALQHGDFQVGPDKTGQMVINNLSGNSTENDRYLKSMQSNIINAASVVAQSQKGSMTNFKFAKDLEQVMPSFANNDKKAAYEALSRVSEGLAGAYNGNANAAINYGKGFSRLQTMVDPSTGEQVPIADYYKSKMKYYGDHEKALTAGKPAFMASPGRGQSTAAPKSFLEFLPSQPTGN